MRTHSQRWSTLASSLALLLAASAIAPAQAPPAAAPAPAESKPVVVVALSGYDKLMQDVDYLGGLFGQPGASQMVEGLLAQRTGGQGLAGLDRTQPIGVTIDFPMMMMPNFSAHLPVTDQSALLAVLANFGATTQDMGDGVTQITVMGQDAYAKMNGGWMQVGLSPAGAAAADPAGLLAPLTAQYDVVLHINVQNLPEPMRQQGEQLISMSARQGLTQRDGESAEDFAARQQLVEADIAANVQMLKELDHMTWGLAIAGDQQRVLLDITIVGLPGTPLAAELVSGAQATTKFAGFVQPDAAATLSFGGPVKPTSAAQLAQALDWVRAKIGGAIDKEAPAEQREAIRSAFGDVLDAVLETAKAGTLDGGAVVHAGADRMTFVAGGLIADPAKIEGALKKLSETLAGNDALPEIAWGAESYNGFTFHVMKAPVRKENAKAIYGEAVDIVLGIGPQAVYFGAGRDALAAVKQTIDASAAEPGKAIAPIELTVAASKILEALAAAAPEDKKPVVQMIAGAVAGAAGHDHVHIVGQPVDNGMQLRFEVEEGVLKAIGMGAMMSQMPAGGPPAPAP